MTPPGDESATGLDFLSALRQRAAKRRAIVIFPEGSDARVLDAVAGCLSDGVLTPILMGVPEQLRGGLKDRGVDSARARFVDPADVEVLERTRAYLRQRRAGRSDAPETLDRWAADPLMQAATMVAGGQAHGSVAGCVRTTADVVRAGLVCIGLTDGIRTLSSSFYMVVPPGHIAGPAVLTFTDAGVVPEPTPEQLAEIATSAVLARRRIVGDEPRVAFLSFSTKGSAEADSVTRMRQALGHFRARMPDVAADGELQGDAALDAAVGARKAPGSPVAGRANVLVFPDLSAANIAYKLVQYLGGIMALGPVLQGLAQPFNDLSRGATAADIQAVSYITALMGT